MSITAVVALIVAALLLSACNRNDAAPDAEVRPDTAASATELDSTVITRRMVIFVDPDSASMARLDQEPAEVREVTGDDAMWYRSQAMMLLDSLGIPYSTAKYKPMKFRVGGAVREFTFPDFRDAWFAILYDGQREPKAIYPIDIHSEIHFLR